MKKESDRMNRAMMSKASRLATAGMTVALAGGLASGAQISDSDFAPGDWAHLIFPFGPNGGSGAIGQTPFGLDGTALFIHNEVGPNFSGAWNLAIYQGFTYIPAISGPLSNLSFSVDACFIDSLQAIGFAITQVGYAWRIGYTLTNPGWATFSLSPSASDYAPYSLGQPALPDFSASGGPIRFGFGAGNSSTGGGYQTTGYFDNFSVIFVPTPGTGAIAAGLALLAGRRRR